MRTPIKIVQLQEYRETSRQEVIDEISTEAFILVRDAAREHGLPIKKVLVEHMRDIATILNSVDGPEALAEILNSISRQIKHD
ncbi:hypothetical protein FHR99_002822 [Litorivivens lipolytica]|uniref:Uncharacterized protein n=1 Tax=Litorivivens lipolytica TaxID=1524264 RepID=A0A7W4W6T4_9GAMM|nr:hypothetical protein [Litorivivens lipolytica]MBB3048548.1 hypothetical protein [Litorivivens lipolytica]